MRLYSKPLCYLIRRNKYFFIGCFLGVILSSIFAPMWDECENPDLSFYNKHNLQIDPDLLSVLKLNRYEYQQFLRLEKWYRQMSTSDYNPVIRNRSSPRTVDQDSKNIQSNELSPNQPLASSMVRDKKLKFYRPRFHSLELNVKIKLLICILIRPQLLSDSYLDLHQTSDENGQSVSDFYRQIIGQYMNETSESVLNDFKDNLLYFYLDISTGNTDNTNKSQQMIIAIDQGKNLDIFPLIYDESHKPFHAQILNYLISRKKIQEYSLVLMISEQTLINVYRLEQLLQSVSVSDLILSSSDGQHQDESINDNASKLKYLTENLGKNDIILNYGLLISSTLILMCHQDWSCYIAKTLEQSQDLNSNPHPIDGNIRYWHDSFQINESSILNKLNNSRIISIEDEDRILKSLFLYPFKYYSESYKVIQTLIIVDSIKNLEKEILNVESTIKLIDNDDGDQILFPGSFQSRKPHNRYEVPRWIYSNETHAFMPNEMEVIRPLTQAESKEILWIKQECFEWIVVNKSNNKIKLDDLKIENLYQKFDAVRGLEFIIDLNVSKVEESTIRRFHILKPLNPVEILTDVPHLTENLRLTMILPVRGYQEVPLAINFLNRYADICSRNPNHQTILIIVLIRTRHLSLNDSIESTLELESKEFERLKKVSLYLQSKFDKNTVKIIFLDINPPDAVYLNMPGEQDHYSPRTKYPSELVYLDMISRSLASSSSDEPILMLHCRTNMLLSMDFLNRVRVNTIVNNQIFVPIPFLEYRLRTSMSNNDFKKILSIKSKTTVSQEFLWSISQLVNAGTDDKNMPPSLSKSSSFWDVRKDSGYFDQTNREFISFYLHDYLRARRQTEDQMPIVRNRQSIVKYQNIYYDSQLDLYEMFEKFNQKQLIDKRLSMMRAVEPELKLFHTTILDNCDHFESNKFSYKSCQNRLIYGLGPKQKLSAIVDEYLQRKKMKLSYENFS